MEELTEVMVGGSDGNGGIDVDKRKMNKRVATSIKLADVGEESDEDEEVKLSDYITAKHGDALEIVSPKKKKKKKKKKYTKFVVLSISIFSKMSSLIDVVTDIFLLNTASNNGAILFTMVLFVCVLSPYILSYSSGIELWLHRRTFEHVKPMTFKSVLLALYLFPTGIIYFIIVDLVDIIVEMYKWFVFNLIYCCKREEVLAQIERSVAEVFGMSRMNWISFKKQKRISQLFFETIPQVTLQCLLYFKAIPNGDSLSGGITPDVLIISITSAVVNAMITIFKLYAESVAVEESFVRYALTNITARYSWVPFTNKIHKFFNDNLAKKKGKKSKYLGIRMITKKDVLDTDDPAVKIHYKIKYRYPLLTGLNKAITGTVDYDFSTVSTETFVAVLKSYRKITNGAKLKIYFADSLRLLGVRDIIKLMQSCSDKDIYLPDIALVDWELAFNNQLKHDVRLFSNHFDESHRPLLTSLYLSGYDNIDFSILREFVFDFDVPINIADDDGNTLLHHMISNSDINAVRALKNSLKFNQRLHLSEMNNLGETVMYLALQHDMRVLAKLPRAKSKDAALDEQDEKELEQEQKDEDNDDDDVISSNFLDGFHDVWLNALQNNEPNDVNYIHPQTLVNFLHLKVNRTALKLLKEHDDTNKSLTVTLETMTVACYKQFNQIMKSNDMQQHMVQMIEPSDVFKLKMTQDIEEESTIKSKLMKQLMHLLLLNDFTNININAVIYNNQTVLGFVLVHFIDFAQYFHIVNYLLSKGAMILASEICSFAPLFVNAASRPNYHSYFNLFDKVIDTSNIRTQSVDDLDENNPIHIAIMSKQSNALNDNNDTGTYIQILSNLCNRYPEWIHLRNNAKDTPVDVAMQNNDVDATVCLYRIMTVTGTVLSTERRTVNNLILMGNYLLSKKQGTVMHLLLMCLDYYDFWYWPSSIAHKFDMSQTSIDTEWMSLVNYVSKQTHKRTLQDILQASGAISKLHMSEYEGQIDTGDASKGKKEKKKKPQVHDAPIAQMQEQSDEKEKNAQDGNEFKDDLADMNVQLHEDQVPKEPINWLEVAYSTVVETFSFLDLYTDIIIFDQLYRSGNMWWTTYMLMLLLAPYFVSYGSLATIFQNNISHEDHPIQSIFILFMMTPLALLYLLTIDVVFIVYALVSTFLFLISCTKIDIREAIDKYVFERIFNMNRTEVVGYRRLRTLSQLFFETMPQILLQLRILWVIEVQGDDSFQIEENTILWSVSLAFSHLILEGGIIYLDSKALRMNFFAYSMVCLGGRVHWVPYQHLMDQVTMRQVFIYYNIDDEDDFDANKCEIRSTYDNDDDNDEFKARRQNRLILNYEAISAVVGGFRYPVTYQFSNQAMQKLAERLTNCSTLQIPELFNISDANAVLHSVMRNVFCSAQINLGYNSVGNVDIYSLCALYEACGLNKIKLNIQSINRRTVNKMLSNTANKTKISAQITESLVNFGELSALEWIHKDPNALPYKQKQDIVDGILDRCLSINKDQFIRIDILRNCYKHKCFIGRDCKTMGKILSIIEQQYRERCLYNDGVCCFAVIFILLYTKGHIFFSDCVNGCCKLDDALKKSLMRYVPTIVEVDDKEIPFELFDCCAELNTHLEGLLLNHFKSYMINTSTVPYTARIVDDEVKVNVTQTQIDSASAGIQMHNGTTDIDDLKQCDQLMHDLRVTKTDIYLKNTFEHRSFHEGTTGINAELTESTIAFEHRVAVSTLMSAAATENKHNCQFMSLQIELKDFECDVDEKTDAIDVDCDIYYCDDDGDVSVMNEVHLLNKQIQINPNSAVIHMPMNCGLSSLNYLSNSTEHFVMIKLATHDQKTKMKFSALVFGMKYWNYGKDDLGAGYVQLNIQDNPNYFVIDDEQLNRNAHNYVIQIPIKARWHFTPPITDLSGVNDRVQFGIHSVCEPDLGTGHAATLVLEQSSRQVLSENSIRFDHDGEIVNKPANERPRLDRFEFGDIVHAEVVFADKTMEYFINGKPIHKTPIVFDFPWYFAVWKKRPSANCKIVVIQDEFVLNKLRNDYTKRMNSSKAADGDDEEKKEEEEEED